VCVQPSLLGRATSRCAPAGRSFNKAYQLEVNPAWVQWSPPVFPLAPSGRKGGANR